MRYQLFLRFDAKSLDEPDSFVAFEEKLAPEFGDVAIVDGHDCRLSDEPLSIFCKFAD
jgi:hypothetical protein